MDANNPGGKPYIGRAKSEERFEARQKEHARKNPDADYKYTTLERTKPSGARTAEQRHINDHGGPTNSSNPSGGTENKRNEIRQCTGSRVGYCP